MNFEAYKIIISDNNALIESACHVLDPPILVAEATGTSVVIEEKQRKRKSG